MLHVAVLRSAKFQFFLLQRNISFALIDLHSHCCCRICYNIKANRGSVKSKKKTVSRYVNDTLQHNYTATLLDSMMNIEVTSLALTLRVRGVVFHAIKQYFVFGLHPFPSFAYTHSTLKPTVFKVAFCSRSGSLSLSMLYVPL